MPTPRLLQVAVLILALLSLSCHQEHYVCRAEMVTLEANNTYVFTFTLSKPAEVSVLAVEVFGKNIEYEILRDGKRVYWSEIRQGSADGKHDVEPGEISIVLLNENWMETKIVRTTISIGPIDSDD